MSKKYAVQVPDGFSPTLGGWLYVMNVSNYDAEEQNPVLLHDTIEQARNTGEVWKCSYRVVDFNERSPDFSEVLETNIRRTQNGYFGADGVYVAERCNTIDINFGA